MDFDEKQEVIDGYVMILHWVLGKRLPFSRSWHNVTIVSHKKRYTVKWYDSKTKEDPEGKAFFSSHGGALTLDGIHEEITNQVDKLEVDQREYLASLK